MKVLIDSTFQLILNLKGGICFQLYNIYYKTSYEYLTIKTILYSPYCTNASLKIGNPKAHFQLLSTEKVSQFNKTV